MATRAEAAADAVRLAAVGDLLLPVDPTGAESPRDTGPLLAEMRPLLEAADVVVGNLELTLPGDGETVPWEPRVVSAPELVRAVAEAGIRVVSLANNHVFDCLWPGFERLRALLAELGVASFGAGADLDEAAAPAVVEAKGLRLAFLGAVDPATGAHRLAGPGSWGVAPLEADALVERIRRLRAEVDHVLVCPHWGEERFAVPSPAQIAQARAFAEAGASAVLGHHPHVLQGIEVHAGTPIIYSLGNFVASEVPYTTGDRVTWNRTERTACVLELELGPGGAVRRVAQRPTYDDGVAVRPDRSGFGARRIRRVDREVAGGVSARRYRWEHLWVKRVKPVLAHLRWSELRRVRPAKLRAGLGRLWRALRGIRSA